jgi:hypothetical protein
VYGGYFANRLLLPPSGAFWISNNAAVTVPNLIANAYIYAPYGAAIACGNAVTYYGNDITYGAVSDSGLTPTPVPAAALTGLIYSNMTGSATSSVPVVGGVIVDDDRGLVGTNETRAVTLTNSGNTFAGNGAGLTNLSSDSVLVSVSGISTTWHRNGSMWWWSTGQQVPFTNMVTTTNVITIAVPGGAMGSNGMMSLSSDWSSTGNTNLYLSYSILFAGTQVGISYYNNNVSSGVGSYRNIDNIRSANSVTTLKCISYLVPFAGTIAVLPIQATFNTTTNFILTLRCSSNFTSTNAFEGMGITILGN